MNDQDQRLAITRALGLLDCICPPNCHDEACPVCIAEMDRPENWPNWLEDLNAARVFEDYLHAKGYLVFNNYIDNLAIVACGPDAQMDGSYEEITTMLLATPRQRAEAFLRTLALWQDQLGSPSS